MLLQVSGGVLAQSIFIGRSSTPSINIKALNMCESVNNGTGGYGGIMLGGSYRGRESVRTAKGTIRNEQKYDKYSMRAKQMLAMVKLNILKDLYNGRM